MKDNGKGPIAWMAGNTVAANLLMAVLMIGGLLFLPQIKQEVMPDFELDWVMVSVSYDGASPEEVEKGIILPIEDAVRGLDGVNEVSSSAREQSGTVTVEAVSGYDLMKLKDEIQSEVERITNFPEDADDPEVTTISRSHEVLQIMVHGNVPETTLRTLAEQVRDDMTLSPHITKTELSLVPDYEISIEIPQDKLRAYGLTLQDVANKIEAASVELPGGSIKASGGEILVRMKERRDYGSQFAATPLLTTSTGSQVLVGDIATVIDAFEDEDIITTYDGEPAIKVEVYRVGDQTPIEVSDAGKEYLAQLRNQLPEGVSVEILNDHSDMFRSRMELLLNNAYLGLGLVFILLGLFLEPRLAFWVGLGIPISFCGAFLFMPATNVSINMLSMFGFLISLGIVVDDAIVVGENVYSNMQKGMNAKQAAITGAREVAVPVIFSVLTNIVTFMPLFFIPGVMGKFMVNIPAVVCVVFAISLIESLFVLPAHLSHVHGKGSPLLQPIVRIQRHVDRWLQGFINRVYRPLLAKSLNARYMLLASAVAVLLLTGAYIASGRIGLTFMERTESDYAYCLAVLPYGSSVEASKKVRDQLLKSGEAVVAANGQDTLCKGYYAQIGGNADNSSGSHVVEAFFYLTDAEQRPMSTFDFVQAWKRKTGRIPGLDTITFKSDKGGPGSGKSFTVELRHKDVDTLKLAAAELAEKLGTYPNASEIDDGFLPGKRQLDFTIRPEAKSLGLSAESVARQVRAAYYGTQATSFQRGRNEVSVMVRLPKSERMTEQSLDDFVLLTDEGKEVLLRDAVDMAEGRSYTSIDRRDGQRIIEVTADIRPESQTDRIRADVVANVLPGLMAKYPGLSYGFEGKQADISEGISSLFTGLLMAMLGIFALLAIPLRSYFQPMVIMTAIPFGMVGAVAGHLIMGYSLSLMSLFGIVALTGVVVNDSLVFLDRINGLRATGLEVHDAIIEAGTQRFRPIVLTTLTTFFGIMPIIFETSRQAKFIIPMALSLGFGIVFATAITLGIVPCLYMILHDAQTLMQRGKDRPPESRQHHTAGGHKA
jgi:multidrug efflux pump subunit AcrB